MRQQSNSEQNADACIQHAVRAREAVEGEHERASAIRRQKYVATEATRRFIGVDAVVVPGGVVQFHW